MRLIKSDSNEQGYCPTCGCGRWRKFNAPQAYQCLDCGNVIQVDPTTTMVDTTFSIIDAHVCCWLKGGAHHAKAKRAAR